MEIEYKIKEECKKYVAEPLRESTYIKSSLYGSFMDASDAAITLNGITDEMFEIINQRIDVECTGDVIMNHEGNNMKVSFTVYGICKNNAEIEMAKYLEKCLNN